MNTPSKINRYLFWRRGFLEQHQPPKIKEWLRGMFSYSCIKFGNLEQGEGDVVIINLKPLQEHISFKDYMNPTHAVERIETKGIYTNIFWARRFFQETVKEIVAP